KLQQDEDRRHTSWIVGEAKRAGWWIYHERSKKWYTPEEFHAEGIVVVENTGRFAKPDYRVMNPQVGLKLRFDYLKKVTDEYFEFKKRIDDYFTTELKKK